MTVPHFLLEDYDISFLSAYKTVARARYYFDMTTMDDVLLLPEMYYFAQSAGIPMVIVGGGTNCLFAFDTYEGIFIRNRYAGYSEPYDVAEKKYIKVNSGEGTTSFALALYQHYSISTLIPWVGLPGTLGGATIGNAGCFGLETADITLPNGQVWAACNVGASIAGIGPASYGSLFQWGRNVSFPSTGPISTVTGPLSAAIANGTIAFITSIASNDWLSPPNNNRWGGVTTSVTNGTYSTVGLSDKILMQGPCSTGYHVPTQNEWCNALDLINGTTGCNYGSAVNLQSWLKLPFGPVINTNGVFDTSFPNYWSSTPTSGNNCARVLIFGGTAYPQIFGACGVGSSVRCLKNPPPPPPNSTLCGGARF